MLLCTTLQSHFLHAQTLIQRVQTLLNALLQQNRSTDIIDSLWKGYGWIDCRSPFFFFHRHARLALWKKTPWGGREGEKEITAGVWRSRERGSEKEEEWHKMKEQKSEREWVKRAESTVLLMALTENGGQALSPASVTVETAAHISTSPEEFKSTPGRKNWGRKIRETKKQSIASLVFSHWQTQESKRVTQNWPGSKTLCSHSSVLSNFKQS